MAPFFMRLRYYLLRFPRSLPVCLVLACMGLGIQPTLAAKDCHSPNFDEITTVKHVHDGDTVILADGRKLRLVGFDTPELGRDRRPAEPLAEAARLQLRDWLKQGEQGIKLVFDQQAEDRYGRVLAHAFLQDGRGIAGLMLAQGLATSLIIPPNLKFSDCYLQAETRAREQKQGLWKLPAYQPLGPGALTPEQLKRHKNRYSVVQSRIFELEQNAHGIVLWLDSDGFGPRLQVFIHQDELPLFSQRQLKTLQGKAVEVRGWLHKKRRTWNMRLRHPGNLKVL